MKNKSSIIAGAGTLYISDVGETIPEFDIDGTWPTDSTGYVDIGFTEAVTVEYEPEYQEIIADGFLTPIKMILTKESAKITTNIHQKDFDTFNAVISASSVSSIAPDTVPGYDVLSIGDGTPVEKQLIFVGKSPEGYARVWVIPVAISTGAFTLEGSNESVPIEVEFTALSNVNATAGARIMYCLNVTELDV